MIVATSFNGKRYNTVASRASIQVSINGKSPKELVSDSEKMTDTNEYILSLLSEIGQLKYQLYGIEPTL